MRLIAAIALIVGLVWVGTVLRPWAASDLTWIRDTSNYYAAGERLNAGHSLYAYSEGDRRVQDLLFGLPSPYLYPPLIGVLWRPLAASLPFEPVILAWWAAGMATLTACMAYLLWRGGIATALGSLVLLVALTWTAWSGNVGTFITVAIVCAWLLLLRGHERWAGSIIGFTSVLKLSPAFLMWWLLVTGRWRGFGTSLVVAAAAMAAGVLGAGLAAHLDFLSVSATVAREGGIPASIVGILATLGAPADVLPLVAPIVALGGAGAVFLLRDHDRAAWAVALATGTVASPIFNLTNVSVLLACFVAFDGVLARSAAAGLKRRSTRTVEHLAQPARA